MAVLVSTALLLVQLPVNASGREAEDGPSLWGLVTHVGDPDKVLTWLSLCY